MITFYRYFRVAKSGAAVLNGPTAWPQFAQFAQAFLEIGTIFSDD